ncbi:MAG: tRNA preQ1(34) S-adenosylmethionine ribosyltransferase-isomerase QueA [Clostridiales bacterium]|nr:tRNA preQ1(34) S-adenosylmethionine ribosyltransferase-isomerase QueA [Clostridiales bacterium]
MDTSLFDYTLPPELIAQQPIEHRDQSRMLVLARAPLDGGANVTIGDRNAESLIHDRFDRLTEYLREGDLLVFNRTRVLPVRLIGRKADTGGRAECFLLHQTAPDVWSCLVKPGRRLQPGTKLVFGQGEMEGRIESRTDTGGRLVRFTWQGDFQTALNHAGQIPLPPYIHETLADAERYQTVYGDVAGSAAASTAGLHFTEKTMASLEAAGIERVMVLLHVGLGTFRPVEAQQVEAHVMHAEYCEVTQEAADAVNRAKAEGRRVIAVGTTALRTLEAHGSGGVLKPGAGWTDIFIYPGYDFQIVDGLLTNFHLPKSSLLMLVSALAGREKVLAAYEEAVRERYRFFSFGDCCLIL